MTPVAHEATRMPIHIACRARAFRFIGWPVCSLIMALCLCAVAHAQVCPTQVVDDRAIHIHSDADAQNVRKNLYQYIWGQDTLPTSDAISVTPNVESPVQCSANLARVDEFQLTMAVQNAGYVELMDGPVTSILGVAYHFVPANPNHRLVIVHQGHLDVDQMDEGPYSGLCDKALVGGEDDLNYYGIQPLINALLVAGYDVVAALMPLYVPGQCKGFQHAALFAPAALPAAGGSGMRYFFDTTLQSINHLLASQTFDDISMAGLSGGGWTTTVYSALDPRISRSFPVAGSLPLYLRDATLTDSLLHSNVVQNPEFVQCGELGDEEQFHSDLYRIAGFPDLYVLGSYGASRAQVQILNRNDTCCFGADQHADPQTYDSDLRDYEGNVRRALQALGNGSFQLQIDEASTLHQISRDAIHNVILGDLDGAHVALSAGSTTQAFARGYNGNVWIAGNAGWRDLGFRTTGVPSALENALYPTQLAVRNAINEPEVLYNNGTQWQTLALPLDGLPHLTYGTGKIISDPIISRAGAAAFDVVAQGTDFRFYRWHIDGTGTTFELAGGSSYAVGTPAVSRSDAGALSIVYRSGETIDSDTTCIESPRVLYGLTQNDLGTWQPEQRFDQTLTAAFPSATIIEGDRRAYYVDPVGSVWENSTNDTRVSSGSASFAGSPSGVIDDGEPGFYVRASSGDIAYFSYDGAWTSSGLGLDIFGPDAAVDTPLNVVGGMYWTGRDGQSKRRVNGIVTTLNVFDTIFRDDFDGPLGTP